MSRPTLATVWLDGCSGCHMSVLDLDEGLLDVTAAWDLVYSPFVDRKTFPDAVDVTLVEGAVGTTDDLERIRAIRARTRTLVALGDCAVTSNVPGLRNAIGVARTTSAAYGTAVPDRVVPRLLDVVRPVHEVVAVDVFLPGCPPPAAAIRAVLDALAAGRTPDTGAHSRFGR